MTVVVTENGMSRNMEAALSDNLLVCGKSEERRSERKKTRIETNRPTDRWTKRKTDK